MPTQPTDITTTETRIHGSFFSQVADTTPVQRALPVSRFLHGLLSRVRVPAIPAPGQDVQDCIPVGSGARYPEGLTRCREHVLDVQAIWLNINNHVFERTDDYWPELDGSPSDRPKSRPVPVPGPIALSDMVTRLERAGIASAVHTTYSHTPECPRFCAIVPLAEAIPVEFLAQATDWILERLGLDNRLASVHLDHLRNPAAINNLLTTPLYWPLIERRVDGGVLSIPVDKIRGRKLLGRPIPEWLADLNCQRAELAGDNAPRGSCSIDPAELLVALGCQVYKERPWVTGTRRRTTCPWAREHVRGIGEDCAVIIYPTTGSPTWICGDAGHRHMGVADLLRAKRGA